MSEFTSRGQDAVANINTRKEVTSSDEFLALPGVQKYLEDRCNNDFEEHPEALANLTLPGRIRGVLELIRRA